MCVLKQGVRCAQGMSPGPSLEGLHLKRQAMPCVWLESVMILKRTGGGIRRKSARASS